jgi:3-phenylpropionate/trans-cinnamate dioxygenase ferredoxin reductase subunit
MTPGLLIAGGGLTAQRCCETLRALGHDGPITIIGPERPYDRPPLSKDMPAEPPWLRPLDWYAEHDVTLREGMAARVHAVPRVLELAGGERLRYGHLLVATGSEPVRLPLLAGYENVQALRTHELSVRLRTALAAGARLAVVGGGLIGLEVASAARRLGAEVTIVEAAPQLLPRLGPEVGARLAALHRAEGTRVLLGAPLARVNGAGADGRGPAVGGAPARVAELVQADGTRAEADHVVEAVGVRPATGWLAGAALDAHVFLAGDVTGGGHWDAAARQGAGVARAARPAAGPGGAALVLERPARPAPALRRRPRRPRAEVTADARGFEAVDRRAGRVTAVLLAARSAADLRAARRRLSPAPELERSAA